MDEFILSLPDWVRLITWLIPITINVYLDRNGAKRHYLAVNTARGFAAIFHGGLIMQTTDLLQYVPLFLFQISSYWLLFELGLNLVTHKPALYHDRREFDSGWVDRWFAKRPIWIHTVAKAVCAVVMVISFVFTLKMY